MSSTTTIKVAAAAVVLFLLGGMALWATLGSRPGRAALPASAPSAATAPTTEAAADPSAEEPYRLADGEVFRRFGPPYSPERVAYVRAKAPLRRPDYKLGRFFVQKADGQTGSATTAWGGDLTVGALLNGGLNTCDEDVEGDRAVIRLPVPGDFVLAAGTTPERFVAALSDLLRQEFQTPATFTFRDVERPVVVLRGAWQPDPGGQTPPRINVYGLTRGKNVSSNGIGSFDDFAKSLSDWVGKRVVVEATGLPAEVWHDEYANGNGSANSRAHAHDLKLVMNHVADQTGLTWSEESRTVRRLIVERVE